MINWNGNGNDEKECTDLCCCVDALTVSPTTVEVLLMEFFFDAEVCTWWIC
jgi:hypothetical protein